MRHETYHHKPHSAESEKNWFATTHAVSGTAVSAWETGTHIREGRLEWTDTFTLLPLVSYAASSQGAKQFLGAAKDVTGRLRDWGKSQVKAYLTTKYRSYLDGWTSETGAIVNPFNHSPISMDDAIDMGIQHVGGQGQIVQSGSGGFQFINTTVDAQGRTITKIVRFDVNPNSPHVQQYGPHVNLETQINGKTVRSGPLADPHIPINPNTIRPGDIP